MSILKAIWDAKERFEMGSQMAAPLLGGDKYRLVSVPAAPATKVYLSRSTFYALLEESDQHVLGEIRETGSLFGMQILWCEGFKLLPSPYIHVTGD